MPKPKQTFWMVCAHADDEWLGASQWIGNGQVKKVIYPFGMTCARQQEAEDICRRFGMQAVFAKDASKLHDVGKADILVPYPSDPHPEHQAALTWALRQFVALPSTRFWEYAIAGRAPYARPIATAAVKRNVFQLTFRSQVFAVTDPAFFLFEGIAPLAPASLTVTFTFAGWHRYPKAPAKVSYLRNTHRHVFYVRLSLLDLFRCDREVEFHMLQAWAEEAWAKRIHADAESCETKAREMAMLARVEYGCPAEVEVFEDGENGAKVRV